MKQTAKEKIDAAAAAAKKATSKVVDKTKDLSHDAGKKLDEGGEIEKGLKQRLRSQAQ